MGPTQFRAGVAMLAVSLLFTGLPATVSAQSTPLCNGQPATIVGTPGDDEITGTAGADVIVSRQGNDVIRGLGGDDIICSGIGDDQIFGGPGFDIIFAAQGDDMIFAASGSTVAERSDSRGARMFGGAGDDTIYGSNRWDRMQGGAGQDTLFGFEGRDWIRAGADADSVDGGPGVDDLHGGAGRDTIALTNGDTVRGGAGSDECNIESGTPTRSISCERPTPTVPESPVTTPQPVAPVVDNTARVEIVNCDVHGESVTIQNVGQSQVNLNGWSLHDEDHNFTHDFDALLLAPGERLTLDSGPDARTGRNQIIFADRHIWNNGGDTATIRRPNGSVADSLSC